MSDLKYKTLAELQTALFYSEKKIKSLSSSLSGEKTRNEWIRKYISEKQKPQNVWVRTMASPHLYIHQINGVCFLSWLKEEDRASALIFPEGDCALLATLEKMAKCKLEFFQS